MPGRRIQPGVHPARKRRKEIHRVLIGSAGGFDEAAFEMLFAAFLNGDVDGARVGRPVTRLQRVAVAQHAAFGGHVLVAGEDEVVVQFAADAAGLIFGGLR